MKNITLICLLLLTIFSCESDENTNPLKGDWELDINLWWRYGTMWLSGSGQL